MDFKLTEKEEALKKEFETFFAAEMKNAPADFGNGGIESIYTSDEGFEFHKYMARKLGEKKMALSGLAKGVRWTRGHDHGTGHL